MNKTELIKEIARRSETTEARTKEIISVFTDVIADTLKSGEDVNITGFGKFYLAEYKARALTHPASGETIKAKATKSPRFKSSRNLKETCRP